jgi:hypothetical protein
MSSVQPRCLIAENDTPRHQRGDDRSRGRISTMTVNLDVARRSAANDDLLLIAGVVMPDAESNAIDRTGGERLASDRSKEFSDCLHGTGTLDGQRGYRTSTRGR